jgi:hypothetical protein
MRLLRGVDQEEKESESARRHRAIRNAQPVNQLEEVIEGRRVGVAVAPAARRNAQSLDDREGLVTLEAPDDPPERAGEPANVVVEWEVFFTGWGRFGKAYHRGENLPRFRVYADRARTTGSG